LRFKPTQNIAVHPQGDLFFFRYRLQSMPDDSLGKKFRRDLLHIREIDLVIRHIIELVPISLRFV
jgi:hypothetical protein